MFLIIDPSLQDGIYQLSLVSSKIFQKKITGKKNRELLFFIDEFLQEHNVKKEELEAIVVVVGQGSFTSLRIACIVANVFSYVFKIKTLTINFRENNDLNKIKTQLFKKKKGEYISALYSAEPNIG
ncbi:MAG: hypothetical protein WC414_01640 [Patescibacteria group bacterium]